MQRPLSLGLASATVVLIASSCLDVPSYGTTFGSLADESDDEVGMPDLPGGDGDGDTGTSGTTSGTTSTTGDGDGDTSSGEEGGVPMTTDTGDGDGDPGFSCSTYAAQQGWGTFYCDNGNGICAGMGVNAADCNLCCQGPSCGEYAGQQGWDWANCEWNGNNACGGQGTPTYDCNHCCGGSNNPTTSTTTTTTGDGDGDGDGGFGYPVGDMTSYPAGGWQVWQVMGHYWGAYGGRHMAQDIAAAGGGLATVNAPVYSVADGVVRYAGPNGSSYKNVVLIEHDDGQGGKVCSFYGHVNPPSVAEGQNVTRGQQITTVRDWAQCVVGGASTNTHLHYVLLSKPLCDASAAANGALICGYDKGGPNDIDTIAEEPYYYTAINDSCGVSQYQNAFISPTKFIQDHHF
jgi:murein DD-endopeptidase MepM/ murein hydrolase activator NlpD